MIKNKIFRIINKKLLILVAFLLFIPSYIFAENYRKDNLIYIKDNDCLRFEINPASYAKWGIKKFATNIFSAKIEEIKNDDTDFAKFREKHKNEAETFKYQDPQWRCYELTIENNTGNRGYGNLVIESKHKTDKDTYWIWPEQFQMYISKLNLNTNKLEEPKLCKKFTNEDAYNENEEEGTFLVKRDFDSAKDGRHYVVKTPFDAQEYNSTYATKEKFRIYVFQKWAEPIPKNLLPGEYTVPLSIRYATRPGMYSMASDAVEDNGKLIVAEDGKMKLRFTFKPMSLSNEKLKELYGEEFAKSVEGHLKKLWGFNSIDEFNKYCNNKGLYSAYKVDLNSSKYIKSTYTRNDFNYPETFEIPLEDSAGNINYEAVKMFNVFVDAMGEKNKPDFNMLIRWQEMKLDKLNITPGKYRTLQLFNPEDDSDKSAFSNLWENNKFKETEDDYKKRLNDKKTGIDSKLNSNMGVNPYYILDYKDGKEDLTVSFVQSVYDSDMLNEFGLVKIDKNKPIQYKGADSKLHEAEVLEETDFTSNPAKKVYQKRITKIKLKDIPLAQKGDINEKIYLGNVGLVYNESDFSDDDIKVSSDSAFWLWNVDLRKRVLVEKYEDKINKKPLEDKIKEAKKIEQGNKSKEAFDVLKKAIVEAETVKEKGF